MRPCPRESVYFWRWIFLKGNSTFRPRNQWIGFFKRALQKGVGRPFHTIVSCKRIQHNLGFWIPRRGLIRIPGIGFQSLLEKHGFRIPMASGIPHAPMPWAEFPIPKPRIPDSTSPHFGFHKPKFFGFQNPLLGVNTNPGNKICGFKNAQIHMEKA